MFGMARLTQSTPLRLAHRSARGVIATLIIALLTSGCVYRLAIQQGNLVDQEKVDQVTLGMTRNQVRFLLGTPLIDDPFNRGRWDYLYYVQPGRKDRIEKRWITLYFEGNSVARIVRDDPPEAEAATAKNEN